MNPLYPKVREEIRSSIMSKIDFSREVQDSEVLDLIDSALEEDRLECSFHVPYSRAGLLQQMRQFGVFLSEEYLPEGIRVRIRCRREDAHRFRSQLEN